MQRHASANADVALTWPIQAVELLNRGAEVSSRERELLKAVLEMEVINSMVGNVKLSMPGLSKIKMEARKSKLKGR